MLIEEKFAQYVAETNAKITRLQVENAELRGEVILLKSLNNQYLNFFAKMPPCDKNNVNNDICIPSPSELDRLRTENIDLKSTVSKQGSKLDRITNIIDC